MSALSDRAVLAACQRTLERSSKSFALAARLLSQRERERAAALYAFCRRADDAIDDAPPARQAAALAELEAELEAVYAGAPGAAEPLQAFAALVRACDIPRLYPAELLRGMAMDVAGTSYDTLDDLLLYCYRVAGVVGLMMCHVLGITRDDALVNAAHLGIAMQLTNICRDVDEDYGLGRVYLPRALLRAAGAQDLDAILAGELPRTESYARAVRSTVRTLLAEADRYYASADRAMSTLPFHAGLAVRTARALYHAIGVVLEKRNFDPSLGRAYVPMPQKLELVSRALARHAVALPEHVGELLRAGGSARTPRRVLGFAETTLALS